MRTSFRIVLNTFSTWTAITANIIIGIILIPFLLNKLGIEAYGLIALATVLISLSIFTDLGIRVSLSRNLAEQIATGNTWKFNQLLSTGFILYLSIGLILACICVLFSPFFADLFRVSASTRIEAVSLIRYYVGPAILILFIKPVFISTLSSNNRFDITNAINTGESIFRGLGILIVLSFTDMGLYGWASVSLTAQFISLVFVHHAARRIWPDIKLHTRYVNKSVFKELFKAGKYIFIQQISWAFRHRINPIILSIFLGPTAAAIYRPAETISMVIRSVIITFAAQLFPLTTGYHVTDNMDKLRAALLRGTRYTLLLAIPVSVIFIIFPQPIIKIWLERSIGQEYLITSSVLFYMAVTDFFLYAGGTQGAVLLGMNKIKFASTISIAFTLLSFSCAVLLVGFTSIGIIGVIVPAVFTGAITRVIFIIHSARLCRITAKDYFIRSYLRPMIIFFVICSAAAISQIFFKPESLRALLVCTFSISVVWIILCWTIGFEHDDKKEFIHLAKSIFKKAVKKPSTDPHIQPFIDWQ